MTFWAPVPPVSGGLAYVSATLLRRDDAPDTVGIPLLAALVGAIVANVTTGVIPDPSGGEQGSLAGCVAGFIIPQAAIALGIPISFNNTIISG